MRGREVVRAGAREGEGVGVWRGALLEAEVGVCEGLGLGEEVCGEREGCAGERDVPEEDEQDGFVVDCVCVSRRYPARSEWMH